MTPEEACAYLGISFDEDLDVNELKKNYEAGKLRYNPERFPHGSPDYTKATETCSKLDEAYRCLSDLYIELYAGREDSAKDDEKHKHESLFMKFAVLLSIIFLVSFAGIMIFVYVIHKDSAPPKAELEIAKNYEILLRELEVLRRKHEETPTPKVENNNNPPADYSALVEKVMPSIVFIQTNIGRGSGFFVSSNGDILTNHHVIEGAEYINVITYDEQRYSALVKDYDSVRDMALIKINMSYSVPFLKISSVLPKQGEAVIAIGNPKGLRGTVSDGIVSAIRHEDNNTWVQFTAPISGGSSGGALFNLKSEVVGMPTLGSVKEDVQNINFAVASTVLNQFLSSAINKPFREIPGRKETPGRAKPNTNSNSDMKFVRKDDLYEMYLQISSIEYDRRTGITSFLTFWIPTAKQRAVMREHPDFTIPHGDDVGVCVLFYNVNFRNNTYLHLRTINFSINDKVIRDYIKPMNEYKWRTPGKGSRIESLMKEVKKYL